MSNKKHLHKSLAAAVISLGGIGVIGGLQANSAHAAVVNKVYRVYRPTVVYSSYENPVATGQVLKANSSWKIIRVARDAHGNTWYDLGRNQWVKVVSQNRRKVAVHRYGRRRYQVVKHAYHQPYYHHYLNHFYPSQAKQRYGVKTYAAKIGGSEAAAKAWIAQRESGGSYRARNGQYIGRYQLSASYLHGDYSAANQERTADRYVRGRYGSWTRAKSFWQIHGWY